MDVCTSLRVCVCKRGVCVYVCARVRVVCVSLLRIQCTVHGDNVIDVSHVRFHHPI